LRQEAARKEEQREFTGNGGRRRVHEKEEDHVLFKFIDGLPGLT
jgi:hypothetical protein